jgi:hypothetical protein
VTEVLAVRRDETYVTQETERGWKADSSEFDDWPILGAEIGTSIADLS